MSVSFIGEDSYSLDLNVGLASRILRAIGYNVTEETCGSMIIPSAEAGILLARLTLNTDDIKYLDYLEELVKELKAAGRSELTWQ